MPLPIILAIAGALAGGALGAFGGVKLGSWLKGNLTEEEQRAVATACKGVGVNSGDDVKNLPVEKQRELAKRLEEIKKNKA